MPLPSARDGGPNPLKAKVLSLLHSGEGGPQGRMRAGQTRRDLILCRRIA